MTQDWSPLNQELARWRAGGLTLPLWWRDDDATEPTRQLETLATLSSDIGLPVHVAVIPQPATPALAGFCAERSQLIPLVHGWQHRNRAPEGAKKAEFGHPRADATDDAIRALVGMQRLFDARMVPVFVPPWNRVDPTLLPALAGIGYTAVSTYLPRAARLAAPGLVRINTHLDPISWRGGRGLIAPETLIGKLVTLLTDRREGRTDTTEPLGFLSHHLVHDDDIWAFTRACLVCLLDGGATPINLLTLKDDLP